MIGVFLSLRFATIAQQGTSVDLRGHSRGYLFMLEISLGFCADDSICDSKGQANQEVPRVAAADPRRGDAPAERERHGMSIPNFAAPSFLEIATSVHNRLRHDGVRQSWIPAIFPSHEDEAAHDAHPQRYAPLTRLGRGRLSEPRIASVGWPSSPGW